MSEKKVVGRTVAIALGIICVILAVGLVGAVVVYTSQIATLTDIINLAKSSVLASSQTVSQGANSYTIWTFSVDYAGYVSVLLEDFEPTRTDNAGVEVIYSSHGVSYYDHITIGVGATAVFPVLPTSNLIVKVGNGYWFNGATETVTITYHY